MCIYARLLYLCKSLFYYILSHIVRLYPFFFSPLFLLHLTRSLFICIADQPSAHHHSTNTTPHHHFTTHKNPITNSIENQSQNQQKSIEIKPKINPNISNGKPKPTWSPLLSHPHRSPLQTQAEALSNLTLAEALSEAKTLFACHCHLCGGFTSSIFLCLINGFWDFDLACLLRFDVACICLGFCLISYVAFWDFSSFWVALGLWKREG